jgi:hypothetical protein
VRNQRVVNEAVLEGGKNMQADIDVIPARIDNFQLPGAAT